MRASTFLCLMALALCAVQHVQAQNIPQGEQAGFPAMAMLSCLALLAGGIYLGVTRGDGDVKGSSSVLGLTFLAVNSVNALLGIFLLFGPGGAQGQGANVNVLGLQMLVAAALGYYVAYTNLRVHTQVLFVIVVVTLLSLLGVFPWMMHVVPIWSVSQQECLSYFIRQQDPNFDRCADKGYLQFIRVMGMFAIVTLLCQAFQLLGALSSGTKLSSNGQAGSEHARSSLLPGFGEQQYVAPAVQTNAHPIAQPYTGPVPDAAPQSTSYQAL